MSYIDKDGSKKTPVVLHRAVFGSIDRFIAYYLEETRGNLPLFLSPVQVKILPVNNEYHLDYAKQILNKLIDEDIRVELDDREEKVGYRMREAVMQKVPIVLVLGQKEVDDKTISYRKYGTEETVTVSKENFISLIKELIETRK